MPPKNHASSLAKISPPEGWRDSEGIGFLGADGADGQRVPLVFVHDIAAWLLASKPLKQVAQDICAAIESHGLEGVFFTRVDDWAEACDTPSEWDDLAGKLDASKIAASLKAAWLIQPWELERLVNTPGFPTEYCSESCTPFEHSRRKGNPVASIAVTYSLANKLWGWGTVGAAAVNAHAASSQPAEKPGSGTSGQSATTDAAPVAIASYEWSDAKTQAALLAAFKDAPGLSARAKAAYLANTEKWGGYSAETLRKKAVDFQKTGVGAGKSKDVTLANAWVNTQRKS